MLTKGELESQLRDQLEELVRERRCVEVEKANAAKDFRENLKDIDEKIDGVLNELETGQGRLPLGTEDRDEL